MTTAAAPVHGVLGLSSPWARQAVPEPLRTALAALVPAGWTVGLSVSANRGWFRAWAVDSERRTGCTFERRSGEAAIRNAIAWIEANG